MTINEEGKALKAEVSKLRPDKRRRYGEALCQRILAWVDRAIASGMTESECGHTLGIRTSRFKMWRTPAPKLEPPPLALVPVESSGIGLLDKRPILITPTGLRIEGLSISEIVALLRELA